MFAALSGRMVERLAQWAKGAGFAAVRADWMARAAGIGGEMRVRFSGRDFLGRFEALDEQGRLLLRLADGGLQAITAGEVFPVAGAPLPIRPPTAGHVD
jgi:BirA family biotin operon repressor/biotin-[acetyl-CoA-carboxylase] ligase